MLINSLMNIYIKTKLRDWIQLLQDDPVAVFCD
jgi:hypothetical protein